MAVVFFISVDDMLYTTYNVNGSYLRGSLS